MTEADTNGNEQTNDQTAAGSWLPDIPVLRNVTQRELNLFVVGLWPGAAVALALAGQKFSAAASVGISFLQRLRQDDDTRGGDGMAGYIRDASSLVTGAVVGCFAMLIMVILLGIEISLPGSGVVA
jgi:hypothetical protein